MGMNPSGSGGSSCSINGSEPPLEVGVDQSMTKRKITPSTLKANALKHEEQQKRLQKYRIQKQGSNGSQNKNIGSGVGTGSGTETGIIDVVGGGVGQRKSSVAKQSYEHEQANHQHHPLRKTASLPIMNKIEGARKSQSTSRRRQIERRTTMSPLSGRRSRPTMRQSRRQVQSRESSVSEPCVLDHSSAHGCGSGASTSDACAQTCSMGSPPRKAASLGTPDRSPPTPSFEAQQHQDPRVFASMRKAAMQRAAAHKASPGCEASSLPQVVDLTSPCALGNSLDSATGVSSELAARLSSKPQGCSMLRAAEAAKLKLTRQLTVNCDAPLPLSHAAQPTRSTIMTQHCSAYLQALALADHPANSQPTTACSIIAGGYTQPHPARMHQVRQVNGRIVSMSPVVVGSGARLMPHHVMATHTAPQIAPNQMASQVVPYMGPQVMARMTPHLMRQTNVAIGHSSSMSSTSSSSLVSQQDSTEDYSSQAIDLSSSASDLINNSHSHSNNNNTARQHQPRSRPVGSPAAATPSAGYNWSAHQAYQTRPHAGRHQPTKQHSSPATYGNASRLPIGQCQQQLNPSVYGSSSSGCCSSSHSSGNQATSRACQASLQDTYRHLQVWQSHDETIKQGAMKLLDKHKQQQLQSSTSKSKQSSSSYSASSSSSSSSASAALMSGQPCSMNSGLLYDSNSSSVSTGVVVNQQSKGVKRNVRPMSFDSATESYNQHQIDKMLSSLTYKADDMTPTDPQTFGYQRLVSTPTMTQVAGEAPDQAKDLSILSLGAKLTGAHRADLLTVLMEKSGQHFRGARDSQQHHHHHNSGAPGSSALSQPESGGELRPNMGRALSSPVLVSGPSRYHYAMPSGQQSFFSTTCSSTSCTKASQPSSTSTGSSRLEADSSVEMIVDSIVDSLADTESAYKAAQLAQSQYQSYAQQHPAQMAQFAGSGSMGAQVAYNKSLAIQSEEAQYQYRHQYQHEQQQLSAMQGHDERNFPYSFQDRTSALDVGRPSAFSLDSMVTQFNSNNVLKPKPDGVVVTGSVVGSASLSSAAEPEKQASAPTGSTAATVASHDVCASASWFLFNPAFDNKSRTGLVYELEMAHHRCACDSFESHPENPLRILLIWQRLYTTGLMARCARISGRPATLDELRLCHSETHVNFFANTPFDRLALDCDDWSQVTSRMTILECGGIGADIDTSWSEEMTPRPARLATGSVIESALHIAQGRLSNVFAVVRPPGQHAERDSPMGFCFFNSIAIAAKVLLAEMSESSKILILDWDVHHGNGIQAQFLNNNRVMYISLHRYEFGEFFPGSGNPSELGQGEGKGFNINVGWSNEPMGDAEYAAAFRCLVMPIARDFNPSIVLVSCGFDAAIGHPPNLGGYFLSPKCFYYMTRQLMQLARGRVLLVLEGGHHFQAIMDCSEACVRALLEKPSRTAPADKYEAARDALQVDLLPESEQTRRPNQSCVQLLQYLSTYVEPSWPVVAKWRELIEMSATDAANSPSIA